MRTLRHLCSIAVVLVAILTTATGVPAKPAAHKAKHWSLHHILYRVVSTPVKATGHAVVYVVKHL